MKTNNMIRILLVTVGLSLLLTSYQNCSGVTVGNPIDESQMHSSPSDAEYSGSIVLTGAELVTAAGGVIEGLNLCISEVEFFSMQSVASSNVKTSVSQQVSISDGTIELENMILTSADVDAVKVTLDADCADNLSAVATLSAGEFSTQNSLVFYLPVSQEQGSIRMINIDFTPLIVSVSDVTSDEELEAAISILDIDSLPSLKVSGESGEPIGKGSN